MGIILTEQQCQEILNEMYIGQTDDILELEKLISKARSKYSGGNTAKNIASVFHDNDLNKIADKIYRRIIKTSIDAIIMTIPVFLCLIFSCSVNSITSCSFDILYRNYL